MAAGVFVMANDPHVVGVIAAAGYDYVHFDMEHTTLDLGRLELLVRTADAAGITPMVRVASGEKAHVLAALEAGAQGIMVPMVETADEAADVVRVARYGPEGRRGVFYLGYGSSYGAMSPADHYASANRELLIAVQIESARGVENAAAIAAVPGVDSLFIGPGDLSQSMGIPGQWRDPRLGAAISQIIRAATGQGKIAGAMPPDLDLAAEWVGQGVRYLATGLDMLLLQRALRAETTDLRERLGWSPQG